MQRSITFTLFTWRPCSNFILQSIKYAYIFFSHSIKVISLVPYSKQKQSNCLKHQQTNSEVHLIYSVPWQGSPVPPGRGGPTIRSDPTIYIVIVSSGESRIIFLSERSSICQYPPKISAINVKKESRARLHLAHPVLYILKMQNTYGTFLKPPFQNQPKSVSASFRT